MPFAARGSVVLTLALALCAAALPARADQPSLLGVSKEWTAYQASTPDGRVCYVLSRPVSSTPRKAARDPVYMLISTWPSRNVQDEIQVIPGYAYRDGEAVSAQVGGRRTEMFSRNTGKSGSAWVKEAADEVATITAMRSGSTITVSGVSARGTRTVDTYSLSGITTALDRAHQACRDTAH